jgi:transposase
MNTISVLGIDLAKRVFQLHGVDDRGKAVLKKTVKRQDLLGFIANLPPCLIGMESCGGASFWAREFQRHGHTVKLIAPQFVKPYVKSNKNDAADAEAIAEAVTRPSMRFVAIKQVVHQDIQSLHRIRSRLLQQRTAVINEIHGLLHEYGIILPLFRDKIPLKLAELLEYESGELTQDAKENFQILVDELKSTNERVKACDRKIQKIINKNEVCQRLSEIPGVGPLTATAVVASVPDAKVFKNGRQFAAFLGLVPRQNSSGGKSVLLGISKRGDTYLRTLLVHGGRSVLLHATGKTDHLSLWALNKKETRGHNRAAVALANKRARVIWAMMATGESYKAA